MLIREYPQPDLDSQKYFHSHLSSGGYGSIFENLSPVVGTLGLALTAVFLFAVMKMDSPFFKADDVYRPQSQSMDIVQGERGDKSSHSNIKINDGHLNSETVVSSLQFQN